jgi:hypothetical protein
MPRLPPEIRMVFPCSEPAARYGLKGACKASLLEVMQSL